MSEDTKSAVEENEIKNPPAVEEETIFPKEVPVAAKLPSKSLWSFSVINFVDGWKFPFGATSSG